MASNRVPPAGATSATTSSAGIVQLTDSTSSTSTTTAATPNAVKSAYDLANGAIAKTLTTTTGDIIYASSANTPARLGIGSTDQVLKVSGGVPVWGATPAQNFIGVSAGGSQSTTIVNGTTYYALVMNAENFDTHGFHDNVTNNTRITIPSGLGGKYLITVSCGPENATGTVGAWRVYVRVNGTGAYDSVSVSQINVNLNSSGSFQMNSNKVTAAGVLNLSAGDYFEVLCSSTNGNGQSNASILTTATYLGA